MPKMLTIEVPTIPAKRSRAPAGIGAGHAARFIRRRAEWNPRGPAGHQVV